MDISVAVVHLKGTAHSDLKKFCTPDKFQVLVLRENGLDSLPKKKIRNNDDTLGEALRLAKSISGLVSFRRAVPIPIHSDLYSADCPSTSSSISTCSSGMSVSYSTLFCVPVTDYDLKGVAVPQGYEFVDLLHLVNEALNMTGKMDVETVHFVERIESWLSGQQQKSTTFLERLFVMKTIGSRFRVCVHNPAANPGFSETCLLLKLENQVCPPVMRKKACSDVEEAVKKSNEVRVQMIQMEKYDKFLMNPVFNVPVARGKRLPDYFAQNRCGFGRHKRFEDQKSPTELWETQFPLHKAAMDDDHDRIQALLDQGYDPNAFDKDSWTPLHYCAFYGKLKVAQVLMNHAGTNVNLKNRKGETALHFAAMNGFHHLIELILSNAKIDREIRNNRGLTPLDMCRSFPKAPWTHCAIALSRSKTVGQAKNLEVHCGDRDVLHMHCDDSTTADELRNEVFTEMKLGHECVRLFAIWIVADRLQLQLNGDQKVLKQLEKYPKYLESWGEALLYGKPGTTPNDRPTICFRRKAMARVQDDEELCQKNPDVVALLFNEAMRNFLSGFCSGREDDNVFFAAIIAILRFGQEQIQDATLSQILPAHLMPSNKKQRASLLSKIEQNVKQIRTKDQFTLQYKFLKNCWMTTSYGSTWFKATMHMSKPTFGTVPVQIGINDYGVSIINLNNHAAMVVLKHKELNPFPDSTDERVSFNVQKGTTVFILATNQAKLIGSLLRKWKEVNKENFLRKIEYEKQHEAAKASNKAAKNLEKKKSEKNPLKKLI